MYKYLYDIYNNFNIESEMNSLYNIIMNSSTIIKKNIKKYRGSHTFNKQLRYVLIIINTLLYNQKIVK